MPDWVLGKLPEAELDAFKSAVVRASKAIELIVADRFTEAMNKYNG
jgi:peptidyl-tRNA hydrolase